MMLRPLSRSFFEPPADLVAPALLGHWLIRNTPDGPCGGPIVETEAYLCNDPACHSFRGATRRNKAMWGPAGAAYVYFIYGNHCCVNAVCQPAGKAEAVLIRAVEALLGLDILRQNRFAKTVVDLTNGPGKLCEAMRIDRTLDGVDLCDGSGPLFVAAGRSQGRFVEENGPVVTSSRIGITKAADLPLRFYLRKSKFVSRREIRAKK
jgi:DNA-3-methyladenine glycosylase